MIVFDNYIHEELLRVKLLHEANMLHEAGTFWKPRDKEPSNLTEQFCEAVFSQFFPKNQSEGFEYWVNVLHPDSSPDLNWHLDKDEHIFETTGESVCPEHGMVFYLHAQRPPGGMLEIQTGDHLERIMPNPNRLIIFNPNRPHRVTECGDLRVTLAANLWDKKPSEENFGSPAREKH